MKTSFNIAENGAGSYRILAILRWVMVVIFVPFGMQKFTLQSAQGILQFSGLELVDRFDGLESGR
jgi:uncharacterized membrane protein YphA (DoxX/SURF4 family)